MATLSRNSLGKYARSVTVALALLALMPGLTYAAKPSPPTVPKLIQPPAGHVPFLLGHAKGTQNYICQQSGSSYTWTLVAPDAKLVDDKGQQIMTHFAGPTWQAKDGSKVVGARVESVPSPSGAIPWLLLQATSTAPGPDGDQLVGTTYIQRVNTTGGVAPATGCDAGHVGATQKVPYTSDYYFYRAKGAGAE